MQVVDLYNEVKSEIIELLHSQYAINILDMIFTIPIFKTSDVARRFPIKNTTLYRLLNRLKEAKILTVIEPAAGRTAEVLAFDALLNLIK